MAASLVDRVDLRALKEVPIVGLEGESLPRVELRQAKRSRWMQLEDQYGCCSTASGFFVVAYC